MQRRLKRIALITGGAGFVGSNLAERLLADPGIEVRVFDDLSRRGVRHNLAWLQKLAASLGAESRFTFIEADVRDLASVREAARGATEIYHLAAQVAVTTSLENPAADFQVNAQGTFNVLEAARLSGESPFLLYTSTNKVYGSLHGVPVKVNGTRYQAADPTFDGVEEIEPLDFHSPYGCSKGAADQYVRDYARIYDLPTVVFRMSCIAGPRQFGNEDQGWVAHFLYSVLAGEPITIYGNGYQVRDILHVHDLLDAFEAARTNATRGEIYNMGGGMDRVLSVVDLVRTIEAETGIPAQLRFADVRPGDQPLYVSSTARFSAHTGWQPRHSLDRILKDIHAFWRTHHELIAPGRKKVEPAMDLQEATA